VQSSVLRNYGITVGNLVELRQSVGTIELRVLQLIGALSERDTPKMSVDLPNF